MAERKTTVPSAPRCIACEHKFSATEIAAMVARERRDDLCLIRCASCGAYNEVRAEPQSGFGAQPALVVRRTLSDPPPHATVFDESVAPGTDVPLKPGEEP